MGISKESTAIWRGGTGVVPEEEPGSDELLIGLSGRLLHDVHVRRVEAQRRCWRAIGYQVHPQQLQGQLSKSFSQESLRTPEEFNQRVMGHNAQHGKAETRQAAQPSTQEYVNVCPAHRSRHKREAQEVCLSQPRSLAPLPMRGNTDEQLSGGIAAFASLPTLPQVSSRVDDI